MEHLKKIKAAKFLNIFSLMRFTDRLNFSPNKNIIFFYIILFSPFFFQQWKLNFTPLYAVSGDEPHFLIIANSLAKDGDMDLKNNYLQRDYGEKLKEYQLDHHTYFIDGGSIISWGDVFQAEKDESGNIHFTQKEKHRDIQPGKLKEISLHPPGYPAILSILFYPLLAKNLPYTESFILFSQLLFFFLTTLYGMRTFFPGKNAVIFFILSLSYPVWTLNASFYSEGILGSFLLLAFCHLARKKTFLFSLDLFMIIFIKEIYIPVAFFFIILFYMENGIRLKFISVPLLSFLSLMLYFFKNYLLFSNPFQTYVPYEINREMTVTITDFLFSSRKGILVFSPHLIFLPHAFAEQFRDNRKRGAMLLIMTLIFIALTLFHKNWSGGPSFSYRTVAPILFFTFPLFYLWFSGNRINSFLKYIFTALLLISFFNMFYSITNLKSSYYSHAYINLINFSESRLAKRF